MEEDKPGRKKPNKLIVEEATSDDVGSTMDTVELFRGDTVSIRGKRRKDTVCIVLADDTCPEEVLKALIVGRDPLNHPSFYILQWGRVIFFPIAQFPIH